LDAAEHDRILGAQHTDSVADFLRTFTGQEGEAAQPAVISEFLNRSNNSELLCKSNLVKNTFIF
jgi:hypothetical protein